MTGADSNSVLAILQGLRIAHIIVVTSVTCIIIVIHIQQRLVLVLGVGFFLQLIRSLELLTLPLTDVLLRVSEVTMAHGKDLMLAWLLPSAWQEHGKTGLGQSSLEKREGSSKGGWQLDTTRARW